MTGAKALHWLTWITSFLNCFSFLFGEYDQQRASPPKAHGKLNIQYISCAHTISLTNTLRKICASFLSIRCFIAFQFYYEGRLLIVFLPGARVLLSYFDRNTCYLVKKQRLNFEFVKPGIRKVLTKMKYVVIEYRHFPSIKLKN